jgi:aminoglycoside phosphotransferase family enzyme
MMEAIARRLAEFYRSAKTGPEIQAFGRPERIRQDTDENFYQTERFRGITISNQAFLFIKERTDRFLERRNIFEGRIRGGSIRECHGDLRLEHIFFGDRIIIFDCIEFNERFRYIDTASDIAFLSMDFAFNGREDLDRCFLQSYVAASSDEGLFEVLDFYRCYRAYVRGKVESFRLEDPLMDEAEKEAAKGRARRYFELSALYAQRL